MGLYRPINLPGLQLSGNIFLAPLAGFTDRAFREICVRHGADLTFSEMVSCEGLIRGNEKTAYLLERSPGERFFGIQIFTSSPGSAEKSLDAVLPWEPSLIDLNCGCPVPKVTKTGSGAALMKDPSRIASIVEALKRGLIRRDRNIPVSVKIRSGWDSDSITYREAARSAVDAGAGMVCLHPRTRSMGYSGTAEWDYIGELASRLTVPVIGSGDLFTPEDAEKMLSTTGCSGVMFARGAIGNPFIFRRTRNLLTRQDPGGEPSPRKKISTALAHLEELLEYLPEEKACREMRKHFCAYTKGIPGGANLRNRIVRAETAEEYFSLTEEFLT
ncbi:MAG: tRNA dihydrouridine synthase DusB [Spirochaetia bacterium]